MSSKSSAERGAEDENSSGCDAHCADRRFPRSAPTAPRLQLASAKSTAGFSGIATLDSTCHFNFRFWARKSTVSFQAWAASSARYPCLLFGFSNA